MDAIILDNIPFEADLNALAKRLHVEPGSRDMDDLRRLAAEALAIGRPKALYGIAYIDSKSEESVVVDGLTLTSRVLRVNLDQVHRVFPYLATGGMELEDWSSAISDILHRFWADTIAETALRYAVKALEAQLDERFQPGRTSSMSPGSLADWPMEQQTPLFHILGDTRAAIGVQLTDSYLMIPRKSVSGLRFPTEVSFTSCQLCPREVCPGRSAPYDAGLYERKYRVEVAGGGEGATAEIQDTR